MTSWRWETKYFIMSIRPSVLGLLVDDGQHDDAEGGLEGRVLVEVVQDDLGQLAPLDLDDDPDAFPVGLVADVGDALDLLLR